MAEHTTHSTHHVVPVQVYLAVFAALIVGTAITVGVAQIDFNTMLGVGGVNLVIAMSIATVKASLVALYFMHLRYGKPFNLVVFVGGVLFLIIFLGLTMVDTSYRDVVDIDFARPTY